MDYRCRILNKTEQSIGGIGNKPLFLFHIASRLIQALRQNGEVCTDVQAALK